MHSQRQNKPTFASPMEMVHYFQCNMPRNYQLEVYAYPDSDNKLPRLAARDMETGVSHTIVLLDHTNWMEIHREVMRLRAS